MGDFHEAAGGSADAMGAGGGPASADACCPSVSVKVTDLFWSPCAAGAHTHTHTNAHEVKSESRQRWMVTISAGVGLGRDG